MRIHFLAVHKLLIFKVFTVKKVKFILYLAFAHSEDYLYSWQFTEGPQEAMRNTTATVINRYCAENNEMCGQTVRTR